MNKAFLAPPSISRILSKNRKSCILTQQSIAHNLKTSLISPKPDPDAEYTFQPKINISNKQRRTIDKFIQDQQKFQLQKERKITELKEEITKWQDEQIKSVPHINSISKQMTTAQWQNGSVFERLSKQKPQKEVISEPQSFSPHILPRSKQISREKGVTDLLYEDAVRRQSKDKIVKESEQRRIQAMCSPKINTNTNNLVRKKIFSEFMYLINEETMNPLLALSVIEEIFNVKLRDTTSPPVRRIIEIIANQKKEVQTQKLWNFIELIIGNNQGYFSKQIQNQIKQKYHFFYQQRMKKEKKSKEQDLPCFRPKTLQNSEEMAERYRAKQFQKISQFIQKQNVHIKIQSETISLEDMLIIGKMKKQKQHQRLKLQKQNQQLIKCTFRPDISPLKQQVKIKPKIVLKQPLKQRSVNDQNLSKQCTDRNNSSKASKVTTSIQKSKDTSNKMLLSKQKRKDIFQRNRKSVENLSVRLFAARTERDYHNKMVVRGYPPGQNGIASSSKKQKKANESILSIKGLKNI